MSDVTESKAWGRWAVALIGLVAVSLLVYWASTLLNKGGSGPKRQTVKIAVLPDTPPPPPPPKVEKPPEPEKQETKAQPQQEQPKVQQANPEPQQLKMDGPAGDGPSAFASGQVSSEYKGGEIGTGNGASRMQFAFFTGRLTRHIQTELARDKGLKGQDYRINVRIWVGENGALQRFELLTSTGNDALDVSLKQALAAITPLDQVPANLPQPLTLRITNRVTG